MTRQDANNPTLALSADQWPALIRTLLSDEASLCWLVNRSAEVLWTSHSPSILISLADRFSSRIGVVSGPDVRLDLAQMAAQSLAESRTITLSAMELTLTTELTSLTDILVRPIVVPDLPPMVLVRLTIDGDRSDLAIEQSRQQGLESLTELAAKIAHELNNPLDGSMRYVGLALRRLERVEDQSGVVKIEEYLASARDALTKMHGILSDLVKFARTGQGEIEQISINELIEQAVRTMVARAQVQKITISTELSETLPAVGTPRLYQVFCNLIRNALDAIDERRRRSPGSPAEVTIRSQQRDGSFDISVEDTGIGFAEPPEKLFEPFYTTKAERGGTGLGLAVAAEILADEGGAIRAEHADSGGARFVVTLPANDSAETTRRATRFGDTGATTGEGADQ